MNDTLKGWLVAIFWVLVIGGLILWFNTGSDNTDSDTGGTSSSVNEPDPNGYDSCTDAHNDGVYDIPESSPAYKSKQDADHDGVACEHYLGN